jgi:hypothetical protein
MLAIPMNKQARESMPKAIQASMYYVPLKDGSGGALIENRGVGKSGRKLKGRLMYVLKKSVKIPARMALRTTFNQLFPAIYNRHAVDAINKAIGK